MKKNYKKDICATNWPLCESPFFYELIKTLNLTDYQKDILTQYHEYGFVKIDLMLSEDEINACVKEIDTLNENDVSKVQESGYHYSKGKRIFEGWKKSNILKSLSLKKDILEILELFYQKKSIPFQTISFNYGSNQPLHSDVIHFHSMPHRWLAGVWVALEDMDNNNGSLVYLPKTHTLPIFDFYDLKIKVPEYGKQFDSYAEYENFILQLVETKELKQETLICKKGEALIWAANLIHGGDIIRDKERTRYSQVTHYFFEGCEKYFSPMFSEAWTGKYAEKNLKEKNFYDN